MLLPNSPLTHNLWLSALQGNQETTCRQQGFNLTNWLLRMIAQSHGEPLNRQRYITLFGDNMENIDQAKPLYFDWCLWSLDHESLPQELKTTYPPTTDTVLKHGQKIMNGGLVNDNGKWSSHT